MDLRLFKKDDLFKATLSFFRDTIGLQLQTKSKMPIDLESQFETFGIKSKKVEEVWNHVDKTYYIGLLDDNNFEKEIAEQEKSDLEDDLEDVEQSDDEYPGILIFAVDLNDGFNPTRSNLTEINRTLNRFSQRVPALVLARYGDKISLMLADRVAYKQEWREGEKVRKVSLLRDIDLDKPHAGHLRILKDLVVPTSGTKEVESFDGLYEYWKEVLDTSELNKKFYQDLSNWYFWAIKHVRFPDEPTAEDAHKQDKERDDMLQEHRATNVIRLLTRLLFVWFIKEKGLIPEELFDLKTLQQDILKEITPYHETGMFKEANKESIYYKAILQNLFFATLNCPIEASSSDDRERGFRSSTRGVHFGVTYLMRYEQYFKEKEKFLDLVNSKVPFLNGGLFECLDERGAKEDKEDRVWVDGFSDNLPKEHKLIVPDFLFFGVEEEVDLSEDYGLKSKKYKEAAVRGLLNIFNSYKFTITENTPIEEDVALDPELLGKVFENLLASYNPETKTTARKQTGSFYTPREIVNYMVDESLIAYLKNAVEDWSVSEEELDEKLHQLTSYEETVPFEGNEELYREIITALSNCTILDPACGSGAFPMGILQKMVHILQKLDTDNEIWEEVQKEKASKEADRAISEIEDKEERGQRLQEINEAFDERINAPDYARKLFLIENCIYGVDIQPVATQISKLRFFISLVVEQKVGEDKSDNFGIRPLPNLETKFVTANTLVDIEGIGSQGSLSYTKEIEKLHEELRQVRSKLFSAKTTVTKSKYRQKDEELRQAISEELKNSGMPADSANKLAKWDPYDQNLSSDFFNPEWMFDTIEGFNLVIGNPPYHQLSKDKSAKESYKDYLKTKYNTSAGRLNLYIFFIHEGLKLCNHSNGLLCYIVPNTLLTQDYYEYTREKLLKETEIKQIIDYSEMPFENAVVENITFIVKRGLNTQDNKVLALEDDLIKRKKIGLIRQSKFLNQRKFSLNIHSDKVVDKILASQQYRKLSSLCLINQGIALKGDKSLSLRDDNPNGEFYKLLDGRNTNKFRIDWDGVYLDYDLDRIHSCKRKDIFQTSEKLFFRRVSKNLIFSYDNEQYFALNTLIVVNKKKGTKEDIKALLGILNSSLLNYFYEKQFKSTKKVFSEIQARSVKELPIPLFRKKEEKLLSVLSSLQIHIAKLNESLDSILFQVLDAVVINIYLSEYLNDLDLNIIKYVYEDVEDVFEGQDYSLQDDLEKVIEQLHDRWSDPENEVRKRINSFPEKSPDILKPILEG